MNHILIVGLGLIGGAMAKQIRAKHPFSRITGFDTNPNSIAFALKNKWITDSIDELSQVSNDVDLAIISTPIPTIGNNIETIANSCANPIIFTDTASVKSSLPSLTLPNQHIYIPGHPMAGSDKTGIENADSVKLEGAPYILIPPPTPEPKYQTLKSFMSNLDYKVVECDAESHDKLTAIISHIPYIMAHISCNLAMAHPQKDQLLQILSTGFLDHTRIAGSNPNWGLNVLTANKEEIIKGLKSIQKNTQSLIAALENDNQDHLLNNLSNVAEFRQNISRD